MKNKIKILNIFALAFIALTTLTSFAYANQITEKTIPARGQNQYYNPRIEQGSSPSVNDPEFLNTFNPEVNASRQNPIVRISRKILSILQLVGVGVALIMLVVTGIQFIASKEKPDIAKTAINYIFGAFCILGATGILSVIQQLVNEFIYMV